MQRLIVALLWLMLPVTGQAQSTPASPESAVRALLDGGRWRDAVAYADSLARRRPTDPSAFTALAVAELGARDLERAVRAADSAVALAPDRSASQLIVAQAYLSHAREFPGISAIGKVRRGRSALDRAIKLDPDNLDARATLMHFLLQAPSIVGGSRSKARDQAREIGRRDRARGLLARLEIAAVVGKEKDLVEVYDAAVPILGTTADSAGRVRAALLDTLRRVKDTKLRNTLAAKL